MQNPCVAALATLSASVWKSACEVAFRFVRRHGVHAPLARGRKSLRMRTVKPADDTSRYRLIRHDVVGTRWLLALVFLANIVHANSDDFFGSFSGAVSGTDGK